MSVTRAWPCGKVSVPSKNHFGHSRKAEAICRYSWLSARRNSCGSPLACSFIRGWNVIDDRSRLAELQRPCSHECQRSHRTVSRLAVRDAPIRQHLSEDARGGGLMCVTSSCDAVAMDSVSDRRQQSRPATSGRAGSSGAVEAAAEVWLIVIDGRARFLCHVSADLEKRIPRIFIFGRIAQMAIQCPCHPMGLVGFYGRRRVRSFVETVKLSHLIQTGELDDPLLRLFVTPGGGGWSRWPGRDGEPCQSFFVSGSSRRCVGDSWRADVTAPDAT